MLQAAIADKELAMKLLKERCLECSICAMFFSSSLTISINALFLSRILSAILIKEFLILFSILVTSRMPLRKRFSNSACPINLYRKRFFFCVYHGSDLFQQHTVIQIPRYKCKIQDFPIIIDY